MKLEDIKKITVIGAGVMGNQIAELFSRLLAYEVNITDVGDELIKNGIKAIGNRIDAFFVAKGKITPEEKAAIMGRIRGCSTVEEAVKGVDFVIEAIPEVMGLKKAVFKKLDELLPDALLTSNTSSLNITEMVVGAKRPDRMVGMHFFNPVAMMKLVEVVRGAHTSDEAVGIAAALARKLGKEPVVCRDTSNGFLANRAYDALRAEAVKIVWEKVASPEDVDKALKFGYNLPAGPLELGDQLGSWGRRHEMEADRIKELGEAGRLHPLIRTMVRAGYPGGPGKKGIYDFWKEVLSKW
jgi:3-hydroxybutyryl-CoA dehydrogenase